MASKAQTSANQKNAQRSTGPRSSEGKKRSSRNATKHGGYAQSVAAIPRGHFAENPDEIEQFVTEIVSSLNPRDRLEDEEAQNVARAYLRLRRVGRLEVESIAGQASDRPTPPDPLADLFSDPSADDPDEVKREQGAVRVLERILSISSRIEARSSVSLDRALARFRDLKSRDLDEVEG